MGFMLMINRGGIARIASVHFTGIILPINNTTNVSGL